MLPIVLVLGLLFNNQICLCCLTCAPRPAASPAAEQPVARHSCCAARPNADAASAATAADSCCSARPPRPQPHTDSSDRCPCRDRCVDGSDRQPMASVEAPRQLIATRGLPVHADVQPAASILGWLPDRDVEFWRGFALDHARGPTVRQAVLCLWLN